MGECLYPVLRVEAGVDDVIHVQVHIVKLDVVRIRCRAVNRHCLLPNVVRLILNAVHNDLGVPTKTRDLQKDVN